MNEAAQQWDKINFNIFIFYRVSCCYFFLPACNLLHELWHANFPCIPAFFCLSKWNLIKLVLNLGYSLKVQEKMWLRLSRLNCTLTLILKQASKLLVGYRIDMSWKTSNSLENNGLILFFNSHSWPHQLIVFILSFNFKMSTLLLTKVCTFVTVTLLCPWKILLGSLQPLKWPMNFCRVNSLGWWKILTLKWLLGLHFHLWNLCLFMLMEKVGYYWKWRQELQRRVVWPKSVYNALKF